MPHESNGSTPETLAIVNRLRADVESLDAAITYDLEIPAIERQVDGGIRWKLRHRASDVRAATERLHRELTEALAELERVRREGDEEPVEPFLGAFPSDAELLAEVG